MRDEPNFGIFEPLFDAKGLYLSLLHLESDDSAATVMLVRNCCNAVPNPHVDIARLLAETNWRPHLVAAVAATVCEFDLQTTKLLWRRIDRGSWVTPQLGAALCLIDPNFISESRLRLEQGRPLDLSELRALSPVERHSAPGPAGSQDRSAKVAATLVRLLEIHSSPGWLKALLESPTLNNLLAQDIDASGKIAESWLERIQDLRGLS